MNTNDKAPAIKTHHHYLVLDGREQRHNGPRRGNTSRRNIARPIQNRALGTALLSAFVDGGRKLTAGMRQDLGLDA